MKKAADVKYPNSAHLFQFCRKVLDCKFGGVRVIDQDVGQILGFDPADCSHWKKGKKNIRSIQAMKSIADFLGVDEKLIVDIASGEMDDEEAFFEYSGYGEFTIDSKMLDIAKKDYYRKNSSSWDEKKEQELRALFELDVNLIDRLVNEIHERVGFHEAPLYLPEVINAYPDLRDLLTQQKTSSDDGKSVDVILGVPVPRRAETRPYMRYCYAKVIGTFLMRRNRMLRDDESQEFGRHIEDVEANIFAAKLLTPADMVRKEMFGLNTSKDIITQLAEAFWVSKTFMNRRLKEILQHQPAI